MSHQAIELGELQTIGLGPNEIQEFVEQIKKVSAQQVKAVAKRYFVQDRMTVAELIPTH